jgi:uncharacterized protein with ParB-like and HNH nuclease domain
MERGLVPFKELVVGEKVFQIPLYQRNYSWEQRQLEDLWTDLLYLDVGKKHYFGTILLKKAGTKQSGLKSFDVYEIIDGQQRITTILILLKEMIVQFQDLCTDEDSKAELEDLEKNYLKYRDIYKLELLGDDAEFFRRQIIDDQDYPDETITPSQRRLKSAKAYFREKFGEVRKSGIDFKEFLTQFKKKVDSLDIIRYPVESNSDAVLIFETVNDRGKPLSRLEKTKSFMMHMVYLSEPEQPDVLLRTIDERFANIYRYLEKIKYATRGDFLDEEAIQRYHFIIYEPTARGDKEASYNYLDYLKNVARNCYRTRKDECLQYIMKYTEDLEKAFFAATEIISAGKTEESGIILNRLFTLERVANFFPMMTATWMRFKNDEEKLKEILRLVESFTFRVYVIGRRRADTGEALADRLSFKIHNNLVEFESICEELRGMISTYENDLNFQNDLKFTEFYDRLSRRDLKYLLFEYEKWLREQVREPIDFELEAILTDQFDIEHIWANNPDIIPSGLEQIHTDYKDKLGNLTIASAAWNRSWGNRAFSQKKAHYSGSSFRIQRELSSFNTWGQNEILDREDQLVAFALQRWKTE